MLFLIHGATVLATCWLVVLSWQYIEESRRTSENKRLNRFQVGAMVALYPVAFASAWADIQWSIHELMIGPIHQASTTLEEMVVANKSVKMALVFILCAWVGGAVVTLRKRETLHEKRRREDIHGGVRV